MNLRRSHSICIALAIATAHMAADGAGPAKREPMSTSAPPTIVRLYRPAPNYRPVKCATGSVDYPPAAARAEVTGTTGLELKFDAAGQVIDGRIGKSSGPLIENVLLDRAALAAMRRCTAGQAANAGSIEEWTPVEYVWKLDEAPPDTETAANVRGAAERGDAKAQYRLAEWLRLGLVEAVNADTSQVWLRRSAEQGCADAQYRLGTQLSQNDPAQAADWLQRASNQGHREALYALAHAYAVGLGVERSDERAHELRLAAARKGVVGTYDTLAWDFHKGRGAPRDDLRAFEWMRKAAAVGYGNALFDLGVAYEEGWSGARDLRSAATMYLIAHRAGDSRAEAEIKRLRALTNAQEWDEAARLAATWVPGQGPPQMP